MEKFKATPVLREIDMQSINTAYQVFQDFRANKVIISGDFQDSRWTLSSESSHVGLDFNLPIYAPGSVADSLGISNKEMQIALKVFVLSCMGTYALHTLQATISDIRKVYVHSFDNLDALDGIHSITQLIDFFSILPADKGAISEILETLECIQDSTVTRPGGQRALASYMSYFEFHDILTHFWEESEINNEKIFFFPVYLWWKISSIIALRPHEFVLLPRNCLVRRDNHNYLTVRRNRIKGSDRVKSYTIRGDYKTDTYQIPDTLATDIQWYIDNTKDLVPPELDTLLYQQPHYDMWDRSTPINTWYYTYVNLHTCLRYFYTDIIVGRYGYTIDDNDDGYRLGLEKRIAMIHLGDARHIALTNLIMDGATPEVAMAIAGHSDINMTAHYYSNVSTLVECRIYRQYRRHQGGTHEYSLSQPTANLRLADYTVLDDGSWCYSAATKRGDYSDCHQAVGPAGEIGLCSCCTYHRDTGTPFGNGDDLYRRRIDAEAKLLGQIIHRVRRSKGATEDITQAVLRLREVAHDYEQYLKETRRKENGT